MTQHPNASSHPTLARARALIDTPPSIDGNSRMPRITRLFRRTVNRGLADHDTQVNLRLNALFDAIEAQQVPPDLWRRLEVIGEHIESLYQVATRLESHSTSQIGATNELRAKFSALHGDLARVQAEVNGPQSLTFGRINALEQHTAALVQDVTARLDSIQNAVDMLDQEHRANPFMTDESALRTVDENGNRVMGFSADTLPATAHYADFEDLFRGSEEMITTRLKPYLPLLDPESPVLDIGCGRGELLLLLRSEGIAARGVDTDPSMVSRCASRDLDVERTDGVTALRSVDPGSLGAVTSVQVVEHLELEPMRELFQASFNALRSGGKLIAETVNPHSPMALKAFWLDLTHIRPLYPEALLLLAREVGFTGAHILFPAGTGDLDNDLRTCGEYALVATK